MERNRRLFHTHLKEYGRRQADLFRGYSQGVNVAVSFYTGKINQHRKMLNRYGTALGMSADAIAKAAADAVRSAQGV